MPARLILGALLLSALLLGAGLTACPRAAAQASIGSFSVSPAVFSFPNVSPGMASSIAAIPSPIALSLTVSGVTSFWVLDVETTTDLVSGGSTIPISNLTWTSGSADFNSSGTMQKGTATAMASGTTSGTFSGQVKYYLANNWTDPTGTYTSTVIYTLIAF